MIIMTRIINIHTFMNTEPIILLPTIIVTIIMAIIIIVVTIRILMVMIRIRFE